MGLEAFLDLIFESIHKKSELIEVSIVYTMLLVDHHVLLEYNKYFLALNFILLPSNLHGHVQLFLLTVHDHLLGEGIVR